MGVFAAGDELSYNIRAIDMEQQRRVMKKIFEVLGAGRHYERKVRSITGEEDSPWDEKEPDREVY